MKRYFYHTDTYLEAVCNHTQRLIEVRCAVGKPAVLIYREWLVSLIFGTSAEIILLDTYPMHDLLERGTYADEHYLEIDRNAFERLLSTYYQNQQLLTHDPERKTAARLRNRATRPERPQ